MTSLVIIGGGHAAAQLIASLLEKKFPGTITLVSDEAMIPYHRPPLSKTLIKDAEAAPAELRAADFYAQGGVQLRLSTHARSIARERKVVVLEQRQGGGREELAYDHLVLATGARVRELPGAPDGTKGLYYLRHYEHAQALRAGLAAAQRVVVLGGGFIGLEIAATARQLGKDVTVLEAAPQLLARSVSPQVSQFLLDTHRQAGIDIRLGVAADRLDIDGGKVAGVIAGGQHIAADMVVAGIGATPDVALAQAAGLPCSDGVVVDTHMATADPAISAIGDCTSFPHPVSAQMLRLESVQNANDQAKTLAARLCGQPEPYTAVPWFWSDQGECRLQITGLWRPGLEPVLRPASRGNGFSVLHFEGESLRAIESVNSPVDQMAARRLMQAGLSPARATAADPAAPLKA
jgi:3-phenylpropionate/trans-cinnamate dioxygenase ferredoxin reductase subunit